MKAQNIKWTPVTEALPDSSRIVLVTVKADWEEWGTIATACCHKSIWNGEAWWEFPHIYTTMHKESGVPEPDEKVIAWADIEPYENEE